MFYNLLEYYGRYVTLMMGKRKEKKNQLWMFYLFNQMYNSENTTKIVAIT